MIPIKINAWPGMSTPAMHTNGRYLKDLGCNTVLLYGVIMIFNSWFKGYAIGQCRWNNYNVQGCLNNNNAVMDVLTNTSNGWHTEYVTLGLSWDFLSALQIQSPRIEVG